MLIDRIKKVGWSKLLLLILFLAYAAVLVTIIRVNRMVGHGDPANYANVARSLVEGKGYTVDYIPHFFRDYPQISHPEDTWPLLQSTFIALSFLLLGVSVFSAKLVNILFLLAIAALTFWIGKKFFSERAGLIASVLVLFNPAILTFSFEPWSDLGLAFFILLFVYLASVSLDTRFLTLKRSIFLGILLGAIYLQKPVGVLVFPFFLIAALLISREFVWKNFKALLIVGLVALVTAFPYLIRNFLLFGLPFYSTIYYYGFLVKYKEYQEVFRIYYDKLPSLTTLKGYGLGYVVSQNLANFRFAISSIFEKGELVGPLILGSSFLGSVRWVRRKGRGVFAGVYCVFVTLFFLFVVFYWHYEVRYFLAFVPFLALASAYSIEKPLRKLPTIPAAVLIVVFLFLSTYSGIKVVAKSLQGGLHEGRIVTSNWIVENTPSDSVIMTMDPWELNFHTRRKAVLIPLADYEAILEIMRKYNVDYLQLGKSSTWGRDDLQDLILGESSDERFTKVYEDSDSLIYRVDL